MKHLSSHISVKKTFLTADIQNQLFQGMQEYALEKIGFAGDHLDQPSTSFEAWENDLFIGAVVIKKFWGQVHIKALYIHPAYRAQGIGKILMEQAFDHSRQEGCDFMFVETLSFQALKFYEKMGFQIEFTRPGYSHDLSFHYLRRDL
jgi:ribosomal protein S18 acetylase RimI-like enzyme